MRRWKALAACCWGWSRTWPYRLSSRRGAARRGHRGKRPSMIFERRFRRVARGGPGRVGRRPGPPADGARSGSGQYRRAAYLWHPREFQVRRLRIRGRAGPAEPPRTGLPSKPFLSGCSGMHWRHGAGSGVEDRHGQLQPDHGGEFRVDMRARYRERRGLGHEIADLAQKRLLFGLMASAVERLFRPVRVSASDPRLQVGALGQKSRILRCETGDYLGHACPEDNM